MRLSRLADRARDALGHGFGRSAQATAGNAGTAGPGRAESRVGSRVGPRVGPEGMPAGGAPRQRTTSASQMPSRRAAPRAHAQAGEGAWEGAGGGSNPNTHLLPSSASSGSGSPPGRHEFSLQNRPDGFDAQGPRHAWQSGRDVRTDPSGSAAARQPAGAYSDRPIPTPQERDAAHVAGLAELKAGLPLHQALVHCNFNVMLENDLKQVSALLKSDKPSERAHAQALQLAPSAPPPGSRSVGRPRNDLAQLQTRTLFGPAARAVLAGRPVDDVASEMGLGSSRTLTQMGALHTFVSQNADQNVSRAATAQAHALLEQVASGHMGACTQLDQLVATTQGKAEMLGGKSAGQVITELDIRNPAAKRALQEFSKQVAWQAVQHVVEDTRRSQVNG